MTSIIPEEVQPVLRVSESANGVTLGKPTDAGFIFIDGNAARVGINTNATSRNLAVYREVALAGSYRTEMAIQRRNTLAGNGAGLLISTLSDSESTANNRTEFYTNLTGDDGSYTGPRMTINHSTGRVGIGLTNPAEALDVVGNIKASGTITPSDDRIKFEEVNITGALPTILKLKPQMYKKAGELGATVEDLSGAILESGLVAQEIYYDTPELRHLVHVPEDASGVEVPPANYPSADPTVDPDYSNWGSTPAAVNYTGLIPYLVRAIQEQQQALNAQQAKIEALEAQLAGRGSSA
jgi:hypothetical protein